MKKLHKNQQKLLSILRKSQGEGLTFRDMQEELGVSSPSVVQHHIGQLEKKGLIRRNPYNPQDYIILDGGTEQEKRTVLLNVYAEAFCGRPESIYSCDIIDQIEISPKVIGFSSDEAFIVKAKGDSMEEKIKDKDYVIARKGEYADSGDVVVCLNNERLMIKKYNLVGLDKIILSSMNQKYEPFIADEDFKILGLVRGVISNRI